MSPSELIKKTYELLWWGTHGIQNRVFSEDPTIFLLFFYSTKKSFKNMFLFDAYIYKETYKISI